MRRRDKVRSQANEAPPPPPPYVLAYQDIDPNTAYMIEVHERNRITIKPYRRLRNCRAKT